ncbi:MULTISPECIES: MipA/OmpV family protein [Undibacterium]|uniref:MipA/OmpV family protein n=1 Tax=Undibacterium parvum TaxID=401471 RepID=A0A3S9HHU5_9BURK|nr:MULTISPECIES: MipA/OmpV family protein [Undibacterium]AZP11659.1 MipA/OmpV family protein [Undibacterium parvum]
MKSHFLALLTLSSAFFGLPAMAQDNGNLASGRASQRSNEQAEQVLGVGVGYGTPLFSDKKQWAAGLLGEANFSNGVFLSTVDGIGYRFLNNANGFSAAASLGVSPWRKESFGDSDGKNHLTGMGDVNARAQANLFLNYDMGAFHFNTAVHQTMGDRHGTSVDLIGRYDVLATKTDLVEVSAGVNFGSSTQNQTFFGVTKAQSARSGNAVYKADAGITGTGVGVTWRHAINQNWITSVSAGAVHLSNVVSDSPLTDKRTVAGIGATVGYRF